MQRNLQVRQIFLQFDVDPAEINKNIQTDASVIGDIKEILLRVNERLTQMNHTEWITHIMDYKVKYPLTYPKPDYQVLMSLRISIKRQTGMPSL